MGYFYVNIPIEFQLQYFNVNITLKYLEYFIYIKTF